MLGNRGSADAGSDLLAAPVLYEGMREREVYLPKETAGLTIIQGDEYEGGQNDLLSDTSLCHTVFPEKRFQILCEVIKA